MPQDPPHDHDDPRYPVHRSDSEWQARLDPMQYEVQRYAGDMLAMLQQLHQQAPIDSLD